MFFRKKTPETLPEKFTRVLSFSESMVDQTAALIEDLKRENNVELVLENYSHLIHDHSDISVMRWRRGDDPRRAISLAHKAYGEMMSYRDSVDPEHSLPMDRIAGVTDWDLAYALFWLMGEREEFELGFPGVLSERYFAYSRFVLHRITDRDVPPPLNAAVQEFQSTCDELVDRNFRDLLMILGDQEPDDEVNVIVTRVSANWSKRRHLNFYQTSAPLLAGYDASNDLSLDYQLACILKKTGREVRGVPHVWPQAWR